MYKYLNFRQRKGLSRGGKGGGPRAKTVIMLSPMTMLGGQRGGNRERKKKKKRKKKSTSGTGIPARPKDEVYQTSIEN